MSGAIPPLPQYVLMAWCLFKAQGLYLYLLYVETALACDVFYSYGEKILRDMEFSFL
jgi:hypothetical protein